VNDLPPWRAAALGALQGLGEFLPISSSGHLIVVPWLLGWPDQSLAFDVALHLGTLAAVVYAFAGDWLRLFRGFFSGLAAGRPFGNPDGRMLGLLALASVPGGVAGLLLDDWAETVFRSPALVGVTMALMGGVLWLADRRAAGPAADEGGEAGEAVGLRDAMLIGCAQALALVPGVSRSGATISAALFLGHRRESAARFSFLLATPITFGAAALKVPAILQGGDWTPVVIGMISAALVGLAAIRLLLRYVRTRDYLPFVWYRFAFAALTLGAVLVRAGGRG
jgi:undecaprenyl-diphosphatase